MARIRLALMLYFFVVTTKLHANPVEGLLEVYEDMVEVLLVLDIFLTKDSWVEDLPCYAPSYSEAGLFFSDDLLRFSARGHTNS